MGVQDESLGCRRRPMQICGSTQVGKESREHLRLLLELDDTSRGDCGRECGVAWRGSFPGQTIIGQRIGGGVHQPGAAREASCEARGDGQSRRVEVAAHSQRRAGRGHRGEQAQAGHRRLAFGTDQRRAGRPESGDGSSYHFRILADEHLTPGLQPVLALLHGKRKPARSLDYGG